MLADVKEPRDAAGVSKASLDIITKMGTEKASSREKPETQRMRTFNHTERETWTEKSIK